MAASAAIVEIGRAERNKRDKHERIIRAARTLFRRDGFERATTSEIAELADVGKGTLFVYARTKEELLVMVFQEEIGRTIERAFATVANAPLLDQLMHVFGVMIEENRRDFELARVFVKEIGFIRGDRHGVDAVMARIFERMSVLIERAQRRGELERSLDPELLAYNLFALYYSFLVIWLGGSTPLPDSKRPSLRQMLELQLKGVSRPTEVSSRRPPKSRRATRQR